LIDGPDDRQTKNSLAEPVAPSYANVRYRPVTSWQTAKFCDAQMLQQTVMDGAGRLNDIRGDNSA
jgi:hypothetical protein